MERQAITIREFCAAFGISRSTAYNLISAGKLRTVKLGSKTLIASAEAARWWATVSTDNAASGPAVGAR